MRSEMGGMRPKLRTALLGGVLLALAALLAVASPTALAQADFNHDRTGYHLDGAHVRARCLSCHALGVLRGTPKDCAQCHILGNRTGTTIIQGPNHVPTTIGTTCDTCHRSTTAFQTWRMDHTATTLPCSACHNGQSFEGVVPKTKSPTHPVTTADCSQCHTSTTSFAVVSRFDHVGVLPGTCLNCHGSTATGRPVGHMPAPASVSCDACHRSTATFSVWTMDHTASNIVVGGGTCSTCHGGQNFLGVTPTVKPSGHLQTAAQCDTCHISTLTPGGFALTNRVNPHPAGYPPTTTCQTAGCHDGVTATGQIAGHIQTTAGAQCGQCHSSTAANFSVGLPNIMNHAFVNIASCATCHGTGRTFPGVTMVTFPTGHIPTSLDCSSCHSNTTIPNGFRVFTMNHTGLTTGCINCHGTSAGGTFLPSTPALVTKPASGHIPTSAPCENCHPASRTSVGDFVNAVAMSHTGIVSGCNLCHDIGASFLPMTPALVTKPAGASHIPTSAPCEWCHLSTTIPNGFKTQSMNHTGVVAGCNACHTTAGVSPIYPAGSQGAIVGQPASHIPTGAQDCAACHTSTQVPGGFKLSVSSFDHVKAGVLPGTCTNCHNGTAATGPITGHIPINAGGSCDSCHSFGIGGFAKWTMRHTGTRNPSNCTACHGAASPSIPGATMVTLNSRGTHFPIGANQCDACHSVPASVAAPGGGTGFATWTMQHSAVSASSCSSCHSTGASWAGAVPVVTYPGSGHIPVTGGTGSACNDCHTASNTPGSGGFKTISTSLHSSASIAGLTCKTCHDLGKSFIASTPPLVTRPASAHIPLTAGGLPAADCNVCHTSTVITGGFATWTMNHSGITTGCNQCHGTTAVLFPSVLNQPTGHTPTGAQDCSVCHTNTNPGGFAFSISGSPHSNAAQRLSPPYNAPCSSCHNGTIATGQIGGHIATGAQCDTCHSFTAATFLTWTMDTTGHNALSTPAACSTCHASGKSFPGAAMVTQGTVTHIPTLAGNECSVCHTGASRSVGGFAAWTMTSHTAVSTATCATCHGAAAASFTNTAGTPIKPAPIGHVAYTASADCSKCHTTTTIPGGFTTRKTDHTLITSTTCSSCHTGQSFPTGVIPKRTTDVSHILTNGADCFTCHTVTTVPGGFATRSMNHSAVNTATCNGCHLGQTFSTGVTPKQKPAPGHIPVLGDCASCHTNTTVPGGFITWNMNHTAVNTASCAACHSTANAASFMASSPALVSQPASHTPAFMGGNDCGNSGCHGTANTGPGGFALAGKTHTAADTGKCNTCHGVTATGQVAGHIITSAQCDTCHVYPPTPAPYTTHFSTWTMRHSAVAATPCSTCHLASPPSKAVTGTYGGTVTIIGAPAGHVALSNTACNQCHTTARDVTNTGVAGSSATSGFATQGAGWTMNHAGVNTATCQNCHTQSAPGITYPTGVLAVFKPANHFTTTADCRTCHSSTTSFKIGSMSHTGIINGCQNCHGNAAPIPFANVTPVSKPVNHIATTNADCSGCHVNTSTFTVWSMNHTYVSIATCNNCHGSQAFATGVVAVAKGANHITTAKDCLTCHSTSSFATFAGGRMGTAEHVANGNIATCTACHSGQAFQGVTPVTKPGNHIPTAGECALCHSTSNFAVGAFATTWNMSHTGIVANCMQCHNGTSFGTTAPLVPVSKIDTPSPGHVPTSADCSNCHTAVSAAAKIPSLWVPSKKPQTHNATLLTGYSGSVCYPCHGLSSATYFGVMYECGTANGLKQGDHKSCTKTNCSSCHGTGSKF